MYQNIEKQPLAYKLTGSGKTNKPNSLTSWDLLFPVISSSDLKCFGFAGEWRENRGCKKKHKFRFLYHSSSKLIKYH